MLDKKDMDIINEVPEIKSFHDRAVSLTKIRKITFNETDKEDRLIMMENYIFKLEKYWADYIQYCMKFQQENREGWERIVNDQNETIKLLCEKIEKERKQFLFALDIHEELHPQKTTYLKRIK